MEVGPEFAPTNPLVTPILTDLYQLTMAYGYWKAGFHTRSAVFDLFFRKNPFKGEFTIFAGLDEVLRFLNTFHFTESDIAYLRENFPHWEPEFFTYLGGLDCSEVTLFAVPEGTIIFPREPMITVEGPLVVVQLLETPLLNLVNFPSLVATNAARMKIAAGPGKHLVEFGLRRSQGPDGGLTATRYSFIGGFTQTSNVLAGKLFGIQIAGTHAHAFVMAFEHMDEVKGRVLKPKDRPTDPGVDLSELVLQKRRALHFENTNNGELTAFTAYALAFPDSFLALVDTYDTLKSGVPNYLCVCAALVELGYSPRGIRLDSGDLAYLSKETRRMFREFAETVGHPELATSMHIVASNDLNEATIYSLKDQGHEIDVFGIGTNLVTCQKQPALGCVFKLVQISDNPRIKMSDDIVKTTIPCHKSVFRLVGANNIPLIDVMTLYPTTSQTDSAPIPNLRFLCRHPFDENKRVYVVPTSVIPLSRPYWQKGRLCAELPTLNEIRLYVDQQLAGFRPDHLRALNPTPYKVSVSRTLFDYMHSLWLNEAPIPVIQ